MAVAINHLTQAGRRASREMKIDLDVAKYMSTHCFHEGRGWDEEEDQRDCNKGYE